MIKILVCILFYCIPLQFAKAQELTEYEVDPIRTALFMDKFQSDIEMFSTGNTPSWSIDLHKNNHIEIYIEPDIQTFATVYQIDSSVNNQITYFSKFEEGFIQMTVKKAICFDEISNRTSAYQSEIHYHNTKSGLYHQLNGCAEWIPDYRLHDIWMLYTIDDHIIDKMKTSPHIPRVEIHLDRMSIFGFGGCNEMRSTIELDRQSITFNKIELFSNDPCKAFQQEKTLFKNLEFQTFQYKFNEGFLVLENTDVKYTFKRTD